MTGMRSADGRGVQRDHERSRIVRLGGGRSGVERGWRPAAGARETRSDAALERVVDVHAFAPAELRRAAHDAGLRRVRVAGEELLANWFGWVNRTLEASADPEHVPWVWRQYAYHGYLLLQSFDRTLLEPRLPAAVFYNLTISARRPADGGDGGGDAGS